MAWQRASGYSTRARAEAAVGRWKQVIGDGLRAHTDERRATEAAVAVYTLNSMLELGRPPDASLPWSARGMLDPAIFPNLGLGGHRIGDHP